MSKKVFAYRLSLPVLYHFSWTGGQQLFRQTAHGDHIAEGLKNDWLHVAPCQVSAKHEEANPLVKM